MRCTTCGRLPSEECCERCHEVMTMLTPIPAPARLDVPCIVAGCTRGQHSRGWCRMHYDRFAREKRAERWGVHRG